MILSVIFVICALLIFLVSLKARFKFGINRSINTPRNTSQSPHAMAESLPYPSTNTTSTPPKTTTTDSCKYSYSPWCPTCERDSPRRRNTHHPVVMAEPPPPCRRRQRDMKSASNSRTSENDYGIVNENVNTAEYYVLGGDDGGAYGCCMGATRAGGDRVNLCELPTTYICGQDNCRKVAPSSCAVSSQCQSVISGTAPHAYLQHKSTHTTNTTTSCPSSTAISPSHAQQLADAQPHPMSHQQSREPVDAVRYDACPFADRARATYNAELTASLRERYQHEMDALRTKLKELKSGRFGAASGAGQQRSALTVKNLDRGRGATPSDAAADVRVIENVEEYKRSLQTAIIGGKADTKDFLTTKRTDGAARNTASRLSVKTRSKLSAVKMRKRKTKDSSKVALGKGATYGGSVSSVSSSDFTESECSDSEAEYSKDDDPPILDESEPSTVSGEGETARTRSPTLTSTATGGDKQKARHPVTLTAKATTTTNVAGAAGDLGDNWPMRESLFAHIPPYINFNSYDATSPFVLPIGRKYLKWKLSTITPVVVRRTLINTGFTLVRKSNDWCGTWGKHMKSPMFKTLKTTQKLNHFAGTFQIGRKDRLWRNMQRLTMKYGLKEFGFLPQTFVLPQDLKLLKHSWMYKNGSGGEKWIIKPPASARGVGIKVINRWSQLPKRMSLIVQRYISDPYLINGSKFDLRLYVLVTSFNPLRIYLYPDGLARFASAKYTSDDRDLRDRYMHLTNYSINKLSSQYTANEDANACQGHKWTLTKLWEYLASKGVDTHQIRANLHSLVIKTILCGESPIVQLCAENVSTRYNCYELFGVDVLLDADLRPWLLEVNISPSLHSASPLDAHVKGPLVKALMDLVQFHLPPRIKKIEGSPPVLDSRLYSNVLSKKERLKHDRISQLESRAEYLNEVLDNLTGDDVRVLIQAEDELVVKGPFERIFPTAKTHKYLEFIEPRYYNRLFDAWECMFEKNRKPGIKMLQSLCVQKIHLKFPKESHAAKKSQSTINTILTNLAAAPATEPHIRHSNDALESLDTDEDDCEETTATLGTIATTNLVATLPKQRINPKTNVNKQQTAATTAVAIVA